MSISILSSNWQVNGCRDRVFADWPNAPTLAFMLIPPAMGQGSASQSRWEKYKILNTPTQCHIHVYPERNRPFVLLLVLHLVQPVPGLGCGYLAAELDLIYLYSFKRICQN